MVILWRAVGPADRPALQLLNNDCFPLRYEESFYDSACNNEAHVYTLAAFDDGPMVAAIVLRVGPASRFEDAVVSTWRSWDDPVSGRPN